MSRRIALVVLSLFISGVAAPAVSTADDSFTPLFDGRTLDGWEGDPALWSVDDGAIIGTTEGVKLKQNTFLSTKKKYKNFVLKAKFKLRNGNSGIQIRSELLPDHVVRGYQADIAEQKYTGILYEERGRGILVEVDPKEVEKHLKKDDWNEYVITADGPKLTFALNGFSTVEYEEKDSKKGASEGVIALQLHVGPDMLVAFKDIEIRELP